jgi:alpha-beta hydrolase superfamily lysophospholipase
MIRAISDAWKIPVQLLIGTKETLVKKRVATGGGRARRTPPASAKAALKSA